MTEWKPLDLQGVKTYPLKARESKVKIADFAKPWQSGAGLNTWLQSLPSILAAQNFQKIVAHMVQAHKTGKPIILAMGAHPIKVGLNPIIIDLCKKGILTGLALNGAGIVHDTEIAMNGQTSEDVAAHLSTGTFGMAEETGCFINEAISAGVQKGYGLGKALGAALVQAQFTYNPYSLLAQAHELDIPVTVHVAIGTDIIHCHPKADGAAIGAASHQDFRMLAGLVAKLEGGVFINLGSAVILPEVFLKAVSLVHNLGHELKKFTTVNMDFIQHYRPMTNVVHRPTLDGGQGYSLVGHHEIMFPLLAAAVIEGLKS